MMKFTITVFLFCCIHSVVLQLSEENNTTTLKTEETTQVSNTLFEEVDKKLYDGMVSPKNGSLHGEELFEEYKFMLACLKRAVDMWIDLSVKRQEGLRISALTLFNMGGPRFIRVPVNEVADGMKKAYNWTDKEVKKLEEIQNECEGEWNRLRRAIL